MRKVRWLLLAAFVLLVGCSGSSSSSGGQPKAVIPETTIDFGNVPVTSDMKDARLKEFVIRNEGVGDLRLKDLQVKTLAGC